MPIPQTEISSCNTVQELIGLHAKHYPYANPGTAISWANKCYSGRLKRQERLSNEVKPTIKHWSECDE